MQKISFIVPDSSQYGVLHHLTEKLYEAFVRAGYTCNLLLKTSIADDKPPANLLISFNGTPSNDDGVFLCDELNLPALSYLLDTPHHYYPLTRSPRMIIACDDEFGSNLLRNIGFHRSFFMPNAIENDLQIESKARIYDVVLFASFMDVEGIRAKWQQLYPKPLSKALEVAVDKTLHTEDISYIGVFQQTLNTTLEEIDPLQLDYFRLFTELEFVLKGIERIALVKSIKDAEVHIFNGSVSECDWKSYFGTSQSNLIFHDPVPYAEMLKVMQQSKIVLNCSLKNKRCLQERLLAGMACGAVGVTNNNGYLETQFKDGEELITYRYGELDRLNALINHLLSDDHAREEIASRGRQNVLVNHTWDARVPFLIERITPILKELNAES